MIEDLTMIATQPVLDTSRPRPRPRPKRTRRRHPRRCRPPSTGAPRKTGEPKAARVARRGQDPPAPEKAGVEEFITVTGCGLPLFIIRG